MERRKTLIFIFILGALAAMAVSYFLSTGGGGPSPNILGNSRKMTLILVLGLLALIAIVAIILSMVKAAKQRQAQWREQADALGDTLELDFDHDPPSGFHHDYTFLPEIKKTGKTNHLARGTIAGRDAFFFENSYVVSTGQTTYTVFHSVYATDAPAWPELSVTPRGPISKLLRKLGMRKGMLLDDPKFNHAFVVKCEDEPFAVTLLTPAMQSFMLGKLKARWRITHGKLFLVYSGSLKLNKMPLSVKRLEEFWSLVPAEVEAWERRGLI